MSQIDGLLHYASVKGIQRYDVFMKCPFLVIFSNKFFHKKRDSEAFTWYLVKMIIRSKNSFESLCYKRRKYRYERRKAKKINYSTMKKLEWTSLARKKSVLSRNYRIWQKADHLEEKGKVLRNASSRRWKAMFIIRKSGSICSSYRIIAS